MRPFDTSDYCPGRPMIWRIEAVLDSGSACYLHLDAISLCLHAGTQRPSACTEILCPAAGTSSICVREEEPLSNLRQCNPSWAYSGQLGKTVDNYRWVGTASGIGVSDFSQPVPDRVGQIRIPPPHAPQAATARARLQALSATRSWPSAP